ncbi:MAG: helix-turn-helix domain-containing protein [Vicinamibacterales bacterium]
MPDQFKTLVCEMFDRGIRFEDARDELERVYIERALVQSDGSLSRAATVLGVHRNTLRRKLADLRRDARRYGRTA